MKAGYCCLYSRLQSEEGTQDPAERSNQRSTLEVGSLDTAAEGTTVHAGRMMRPSFSLPCACVLACSFNSARMSSI